MVRRVWTSNWQFAQGVQGGRSNRGRDDDKTRTERATGAVIPRSERGERGA